MEVPTATWTVVQFLDDETVEAVPTNWLDGDKCYWPPLQQPKLSHAIKKLEPAQPTWRKFTVKNFRNGIFNDYAKARSKAKEAEEISDLQSEVDESGVPRKRKIYRPSWATSSEELPSSDERMLRTPPRLERKPKIVAAISEESPSLLKRQRPCEPRRQAEEGAKSFSPTDAVISEDSPPLLKRHRPCETRQEAEEEARSFTPIENQGTSQVDNNSARLETYCKNILEQQHLLRSLLTEVLRRVDVLETKFNEKSVPERGGTSMFKQNIVFPINCEEELQKFESYLQDENNFRDAVNELTALGGSNNYHFVKRVMTCLMTNEFGIGYSWLGRKGKKVFNTLKVAKIIIEAAEKSGLAKTKNETEISIQSWLRRAFERTKATAKDL